MHKKFSRLSTEIVDYNKFNNIYFYKLQKVVQPLIAILTLYTPFFSILPNLNFEKITLKFFKIKRLKMEPCKGLECQT